LQSYPVSFIYVGTDEVQHFQPSLDGPSSNGTHAEVAAAKDENLNEVDY
jgi:hypothetical protein